MIVFIQSPSSGNVKLLLLFFFNYYLFILLSRALVAACGSLTRNRTQAAEPPAKSQPASSYDFIHPIFHSSINPFLRLYVLVTLQK